MFQESEVESCEHQDDPYIYRQPLPEPVLEEQDIGRDDHGGHQGYVECGGHLSSHFGRRSSAPRFNGSLRCSQAAAKPSAWANCWAAFYART